MSTPIKPRNKVYYGEYSLKHWIDLMLKGNIILPKYQRSFIWSEKQVKNLIDALKENQFVPPVTIGTSLDKVRVDGNLILDGQQRLTSILLSYLELFPKTSIFRKTTEKFANENDDEEKDEQDNNPADVEWTYQFLTDIGNNKEDIHKKINWDNYNKIKDLNISEKFFETTFLGFSYLVPGVSEQTERTKYYSSVFKNINTQGNPLSFMESRKALYFLNKDLTLFFDPVCVNKIKVKNIGLEAQFDFVRCVSLLSQYYKDNLSKNIARGYKTMMEKYYEEYIYSVINDTDDMYGKFSNIFQDKKYEERFSELDKALSSLNISEQIFQSIIDLDMYLFGIVYIIILKNKKIDLNQAPKLKAEIEQASKNFKDNSMHKKSPGNMQHLRERIESSIKTYEKYEM